MEIIYITKSGCAICQMYKSIFSRLASVRPEWRLTEKRVDMNNVLEFKNTYGLNNTVPFIAVLDDSGNLLGSIEGAKLRLEDLVKKIESFEE